MSLNFNKVLNVAVRVLKYPEELLLYQGDTPKGKAIFNAPSGITIHVDYNTLEVKNVTLFEDTYND